MIDETKLLKRLDDYLTATNEIGAQYIKSDQFDENQSGIILGSLDFIYRLILDVRSGANAKIEIVQFIRMMEEISPKKKPLGVGIQDVKRYKNKEGKNFGLDGKQRIYFCDAWSV